jgi:hypothetical protein
MTHVILQAQKTDDSWLLVKYTMTFPQGGGRQMAERGGEESLTRSEAGEDMHSVICCTIHIPGNERVHYGMLL